MTTSPPASTAFAAVSPAFSTHTYVPQAVTAGAASGRDATAATSRPRSLHMKCLPVTSGGMVSWASQPNKSV